MFLIGGMEPKAEVGLFTRHWASSIFSHTVSGLLIGKKGVGLLLWRWKAVAHHGPLQQLHLLRDPSPRREAGGGDHRPRGGRSLVRFLPVEERDPGPGGSVYIQ